MNAFLTLSFSVWIFGNAVISLLIENKVSYYGYSVIRVTPVTESQLTYLLEVNGNSSFGTDFWLRTTAVNRSADVMISPFSKEFFIRQLVERQIPHHFLIRDIGKMIEKDLTPVVPNPDANPWINFFTQYNRYSEILDFFSQLSESYPEFVTVLEIGRTFEDRPLMLFKISTSKIIEKPVIWVQGGSHAREFIGPAAVTYFALQLVAGYGLDKHITTVLNAFDWYILPVLNPDGYEYAHTTNRLWRKTRSINPSSPGCIGTDANRNWDIAWNFALGASRDPCSHNYGGKKPFSEPETLSVSNFMLSRLKGRILLFLDIHSYSQRWLTPYGYTTTLPPNYEDQKELAKVATTALEKVHGTKFTIGSSANALYTVNGGARDWVYDNIGAEYSYVVELRDKGHCGFLLMKAQIIPTVEETWIGVHSMVCELAKQRNTPRAPEFPYDI